MNNVFSSFDFWPREEQDKLVQLFAEKIREEGMPHNPGFIWEGKVTHGGFDLLAQVYSSPDRQCLRFQVNGKGPYQALSVRGFSRGFQIGGRCPDWAQFPQGKQEGLRIVSQYLAPPEVGSSSDSVH